MKEAQIIAGKARMRICDSCVKKMPISTPKEALSKRST
jgi:hypothetical protein